MVNPRHELPSVTGTAAEAMTDQAEERVEHAARIRTQRHCRPKRNFPRSIDNGLFEGTLPRPRDDDAKSPGVWCPWFAATENTCVLVVGTVEPMRIDRSGARL